MRTRRNKEEFEGRHRKWRVGGAAAAAVVALVFGVVSPASALQITDPLGNMQWTGAGFLYVEEGETVNLNLRGRGGTYTATQPDGTPLEFVGDDGVPRGTTCAAPCLANVVATQTGVWSLTGSTAEPWTATSTYSQIIEVFTADGDPVSGRFFTEVLGGSQHRYGRTDVQFWTLSEHGTLYNVELLGLSGYGTSIRLNNLGAVHADTCLPTYFSVPLAIRDDEELELNAADYTANPSGCPNLIPYRIFLEQPDPDMPADVALWADGRTTDTWMNPAYAPAQISDVSFSPDTASSQAGSVAFTVTGQPGNVTVGFDVDGDGELTGERDVLLPVIPAPTGTSTVHWDGLDGLGDPVPLGVQVPILVSFSGQDELHIALRDTEGLWGGIRAEQIVGAEPGLTDISWDDSKLTVRTVGNDALYATEPRVGESVDSHAGAQGVRGWGRPTSGSIYGWGDGRLMSAWMRSSIHVTGTGHTVARGSELAITKTATVTTASPGDTVEYTVRLENNGDADYIEPGGLTVTDTLVLGASLAESVTDITASVGTATRTGDSISWVIPELTAGGHAELRYTVTLTSDTSEEARTLDNWAFVGSVTPTECVSDDLCASASVLIPATEITPTDPPTDPETPDDSELPSTGMDASALQSTLAVGLLFLLGAGVLRMLSRRGVDERA